METVPYNRYYMLAMQAVPCCRDCSPNSPKRKTARSGTAPYNLIAHVPRWRGCKGWLLVYPAERLKTVPYNRHYMLAM
ncbi:MAG: hypothetical protein WAW22_11460 [Smithellaceae bacterium]